MQRTLDERTRKARRDQAKIPKGGGLRKVQDHETSSIRHRGRFGGCTKEDVTLREFEFLHASLFHWEIIEDSAGQWFPTRARFRAAYRLTERFQSASGPNGCGKTTFSKRLRQAQLPA
jgi:hypothetical protein